MNAMGELDGAMVRLAVYALGAITLILFAQIIAYSSITVFNHRKNKKRKKWYPEWSKRLNDHLSGKDRIRPAEVEQGERKAFRDLLIFFYLGGNEESDSIKTGSGSPLVEKKKRKLRMLYRDMGFLADDMKALGSGPWWQRTVAFGRLARMELNDGEDVALDLVCARENELAISAISYLSSIRSRYLPQQLTTIYQWNESWMHKEITLELMKADIDHGTISDLSRDPQPEVRKAAAMLTDGRASSRAIKYLSELAFDRDSDVRLETAKALGRIGGIKAARILDRMAGDRVSDVRSAVAESLGRNTDLKRLDPLEKLARDRDRNVRVMAFANLSRQGWEGTASMEELSRTDSDLGREFASNG